jgi:hypothetical protein
MSDRAAVESALMARLPAIREAALGLPFAVRQDKNNFVRGTITDVEFGRFQQNARSLQMIFKVTMECGSAKVARSFFVASVPR